MRALKYLTPILCLLALVARPAAAQSAQPFSVQFSALQASVFGDAYTGSGIGSGVGIEAQVRYNRLLGGSGLSLGIGYQRTSHAVTGIDDNATLSGPFLEPRFRLDVRPLRELGVAYVSARLSSLSIDLKSQGTRGSGSGVTLNGGGGVLWRLASRLNLDTGVTYGYSSFGQFTLADATGSGVTSPGGSGSNIILRVGIVFGFGL
jgi:hypothetical protein